ncbi:hypothetical protein WIW50_06605 [Flavobacteriaceae bacterium 3-367]|uniref:hypothetical protein n=1 Tax=Eudoraea algarum TaxID=3417568 RepID=UPI003293ED18
MRKELFLTCLAILLWVLIFMWLGRAYGNIDLWAVMLIGATLIAFFGLLGLPGGIAPDGSIKESRVRLAIAGSLIIIYLVYFGSVVYLDDSPKGVDGKTVESFAETMMPTLTNLLTVTISFYFGATAAIEVADAVSKKKKGNKP